MIKHFLYIYTALIFLSATNSIAEDCSSQNNIIATSSLEATASTWSNMRNHQGSVVFETSRLFHEARDLINATDRTINLCGKSCQNAKYPEMIFISVPKKFLTDYSEFDKCSNYLNQTTNNPLLFTKILPIELDSLIQWIGDFSQGSGKEGKDLYNRCDGRCSPQYNYKITVQKEQLLINATVICGHARDKDDNLYKLSYQLVWPCTER